MRGSLAQLWDLLVGDAAFRVVVPSIAVAALLRVSHGLYEDPWSTIIESLASVVTSVSLFVLILRLVREGVMEYQRIRDTSSGDTDGV